MGQWLQRNMNIQVCPGAVRKHEVINKRFLTKTFSQKFGFIVLTRFTS